MLRVAQRLLLIALVLLSLCALGGYWAINRYLDTPMELTTDDEAVLVPRGSNLTQVTRSLTDRGLLTSPGLLTGYAKITGQGDILAGDYLLEAGTTPRELLAKLRQGAVVQYQITFPEGLNFQQWLELLAAHNKLDGTPEFEARELDLDHPEGWFFPDTYNFSGGDSPADILRRAHLRMLEVLEQEWPERQAELPYQTPYEALILASIVEKETGQPSEREMIAGVFVRRLQKNMRLQTDPTVIYGLGAAFEGNLTRRHLKQPTAYNTYIIKGLPPTPIAMPGREAIHAVLHPAAGDALFFVAKGDGSHYFSATLDEHLAAVKQYQLKRNGNYRSSPGD